MKIPGEPQVNVKNLESEVARLRSRSVETERLIATLVATVADLEDRIEYLE